MMSSPGVIDDDQKTFRPSVRQIDRDCRRCGNTCRCRGGIRDECGVWQWRDRALRPILRRLRGRCRDGEVGFAILQGRPLDLAFKGPDGRDLKTADFAGKTVLLNLWATWCGPCREEMPALNALQKGMGAKDFEVVAVNIDTGSDEKPKAFLAEYGVDTLGYYRDSSMGVFNSLKKEGLAFGLPVTLVMDKKGCLISAMNGPAAWDSPDAKALITAAKGPSPAISN
jgi:thiol-disulfide isomerase/thioredoxin